MAVGLVVGLQNDPPTAGVRNLLSRQVLDFVLSLLHLFGDLGGLYELAATLAIFLSVHY